MKKAISAQNTKMYLEDPNAASTAAGTITNASKSKPCVAIFDNVSNLTSGGPVSINGTGWDDLDGSTFIIQNIDTETNSATLAGSDTSMESATFTPDTATYVVPNFIDVCAVSYQINQNAAAEIDTTTLCDTEKTSLVGFTDPGTLTFDFFIDPTDPDYQALMDAQADGDERWFIIIYRNGAIRALPVIVQQVNESGGVDQAITGSCTMKVTGAPVLTMPAGDVTDDYVLVAITTPTTGDAPLDVSMIINESGGTAIRFAIDWGDGSDIDTATTNTADHTYDDPGTYTPSVVATVGGMDTPAFKSQTTISVSGGEGTVTQITGTDGIDTPADGQSTAGMYFTAKDDNGDPVEGVELTFSVDGDASCTPKTATTESDGRASTQVKDATVEQVTVTAKAGSVTGTAKVTFTDGSTT